MRTRNETTEQIRARVKMESLLIALSVAGGRFRRSVKREIRELACLVPWLADQIPDDVWNEVYCVRAVGTIAPLGLVK